LQCRSCDTDNLRCFAGRIRLLAHRSYYYYSLDRYVKVEVVSPRRDGGDEAEEKYRSAACIG
jgi:hypothetical protein